jgi:hypothetical protein
LIAAESYLRTASPLSGRGFFAVNHTIITSVIGSATTYIVVLLQFGSSAPPTPDLSGMNNNVTQN